MEMNSRKMAATSEHCCGSESERGSMQEQSQCSKFRMFSYLRQVRCIKKVTIWAIITDETTDRHHREQHVVVIRFVFSESGTWRCYGNPTAITDIYTDI